MITHHGLVSVPLEITGLACGYRFGTSEITKIDYTENKIKADLYWLRRAFWERNINGCHRLDVVLFNACKGVSEHVDKLNLKDFETYSYVIPLVLPTGKSILYCENDPVEVKLNHMYSFDHQKRHGLNLEDERGGCVFLMIGIKK